MSQPTTFAGALVYVCSTPENADIPDVTTAAALTYIQVGKVGKLGGYGNKTNIVSYPVLDKLLTLKAKGMTDGGSFTIECARDNTDVGQIALKTAADPASQNNYVVKIAYANGEVHFVRGPIGGPEHSAGGNEAFRTDTFTLGVNQILGS
jgi:hypothetical protein